MACGIQKLFSVEAEFEDEDLVLAVEDVEKQVSDPTPAGSRCLRPPSSALRNPSNATEALSPVLPVQNHSRLSFLQDSCPSEIKNNQVTSSSVDRVQKAQTTLSAQSGLNCSSGPRFKFVKRHLTVPSSHDGDFDNELLLAACMDLEESEMLLCPGPSGSDCERMGDGRISDTGTAKKMRVADSAVSSSAVNAETTQLKRTQKEALVGVGGHLQPVEASPRLALRPTAMGSHPSQSNQGLSIAGGTILSPGCQLPKLFQASLDKPVAAYNSSRLPLIQPSPAPGIAPPRPCTLHVPHQSSFTSKMANQGTQLLTSYGPSVASVESSPVTPGTPCSGTPSGSLQVPVVTNHLVRLVTAANRPLQSLARVPLLGKTRRFPGPAGVLPHQPDGKNLEEIMVSAPQTPSHGALAKVRTEEIPASQQPAEEDCSRGAWISMKTELGLDERDPSCFLRTYSVAMVLRKAALKQLPKNKVPNMAVMIKSLTRTNVDAGAIFKDPTGEMQGTIHRLLLEQRENEFKAGSVLLLKQVGVFSPSHRNHYLNVTPNNLVKIYPPGLSSGKPTQLSQEIGGRMEMLLPQAESGFHPDSPTDAQPTTAVRDCGKGQSCEMGKSCCQRPLTSRKEASLPEAGGMDELALSASSSKAGSDDLDQLLGELPDDFFSNPDTQSALSSCRIQYCRDPAVHNALYTGDLPRVQSIFKDETTANMIVETISEELVWSAELGMWVLTPQKKHTSPLSITAARGYRDCVKHLLLQGAQVDTVVGGRAALHESCASHRAECTRLLLTYGANPNILSEEGLAPLHLCTTQETLPCAQLLLEYGALVNQHTRDHRASPLHVAAKHGLDDHMKLYICYGANVAHRNREGETALNAACASADRPEDAGRYYRVVKRLLDAGADVRVAGRKNHTPLHNACSNCHAHLVELLLQHGAEVNVSNCAGYTPVDCALQAVEDYLAGEPERVIVTLLDHGAAPINPKMLKFCASSPRVMEVVLNSYGLIPSCDSWLGAVPPEVWRKHQWFYDSVLQLVNQPRPLQHLSRCAIRKQLGAQCHLGIAELKLPSSLKDYLHLPLEGYLK